MASGLVTHEISDGVATITLDDGKRNALSPALLDEFWSAIDAAEAASAAILLTGRDGALSAGYDLSVIQQGPDQTIEMMSRGGDVLLRLYGYPRPVVLACTGHALAGGALFLCVADRRVGAAGDYKIGMNEHQIGLPLPGVALELTRDRLSKRHFVQATLEARIYDPETALDAGWLDAVVDAGEVADVARADAQRLASLPPAAYERSKLTSRRVVLDTMRKMMQSEMDDITSAMQL